MKKSVKPANKGEIVAKLKGKLEVLEEEIRKDVSVPVVASFGFIIALVWRDAIKGVLDEFLIRRGLTENAYLYNFVSAIIVTIVVISIMIFVTRFSQAKKKKRINRNLGKISKSLEKK